MLESLHLKNVGPAPEMTMDLAPRLNLLTGDNGLGKSLLLDCAWWALTRMWPVTWGGKGIVPATELAEIDWVEQRGAQSLASRAKYDFTEARWHREVEFDPSTSYLDRDESRRSGALALYLRVDGGISVYDPLREGEPWKHRFGRTGFADDTGVFQFGERDIWDGLTLASDPSVRFNEGLVRDVVRWALEPGNAEFDELAGLIERLAGPDQYRLTRKVERVYVDDPRDFPIVTGPAGELPIAHAPAGLRRILGLAYLIVWAWREHGIAARLKRRPPNTSLVLLIDEVENHLHPKWQRTLLPSILGALGHDVQLQVVATTHSPLVLASVEPVFDVAKDAWFDLDLEQHRVVLRKRPFIRRGEVGNWLVSDAFDLKEPRSLESEQAIARAQAVLDAEAPSRDDIQAADKALREAGLPDIDPFWVPWGYLMEQQKAAGRTP